MSTFEIIQTSVGSGVLLLLWRVAFSSGKNKSTMESIDKKLDLMIIDINQIKRDINSIDCRLSRLEGAFYERGYWESRKTGIEEKK